MKNKRYVYLVSPVLSSSALAAAAAATVTIAVAVAVCVHVGSRMVTAAVVAVGVVRIGSCSHCRRLCWSLLVKEVG
jgi:Mg2+/citrate symporter